MCQTTIYRIQLASNHRRGRLPYKPLNKQLFSWIVLGNQDELSITPLNYDSPIDSNIQGGMGAPLDIIDNDILENYRDYLNMPTHSIHTFYGISDEPVQSFGIDCEYHCMMPIFINFKKYLYHKKTDSFEINNVYDQIKSLKAQLSSTKLPIKVVYLNSLDSSDVILLVLFNNIALAKEIEIEIYKYGCMEFTYASICVNHHVADENILSSLNSKDKFNIVMSMSTNNLSSFNALKQEVESSFKQLSIELSIGFDNLRLFIENVTFQSLVKIQTTQTVVCDNFKTELLFPEDGFNENNSPCDSERVIEIIKLKIEDWIELLRSVSQYNSNSHKFLKPHILDGLYEIATNFEQFFKLRSLDDILFQMINSVEAYFNMIRTAFQELLALEPDATEVQRDEISKSIDQDSLTDYIQNVSILLGQTVSTSLFKSLSTIENCDQLFRIMHDCNKQYYAASLSYLQSKR